MKICILTVIKNEHLYLDEWIKYHLDMGVNHIFIFEDIDSDSHKSITDEYGDRVTLSQISVILSDSDKEMATKLKATKKSSVHQLYLNKLLLYIQKEYSCLYDWCFTIDNDEFITLEKENDNLKDIISLYKEYDAFVLSWKCYGASGIINKPDYSFRGVVETYTKETPCKNIEKQGCACKTCYNIKSYQSNFFFNSHHPSECCNWCNSVKSKDCNTQSLKYIYLRHYITKSWEEYVWKINTRGFMWGLRRNYDFFFRINPDMKTEKDDLILQTEKETLIVMPYSNKKSQGEEIKIALSAWKKFCKSQYHFIVIGEFEDSLKKEYPWVEFIFVRDKEKVSGQYNPHLDIQHKMEVAYNLYGDKYNGFVQMCDDIYAIKPFVVSDFFTIYYHSQSFAGTEKSPTWYWTHDKWKTRQLLDKENLCHTNYTTHFPYYYDFEKLKDIWNKYNMREESYVLEDVYFNSFSHEKPILDSLIRLGIWNHDIFINDFQKAVENPNIKFVCNSVEGWSKELESALWNIIQER